MNLLAIVGSPRKGKNTDRLVDKAVGGFIDAAPGCDVEKIRLADYGIEYCKNCLACRDNKDRTSPYVKCAIDDDMKIIAEKLEKSDRVILGASVHMAYANALTMTFLERVCWTFAKPEGKILFTKGVPVPRGDKKRKAALIVTSGQVPPMLRRFCDQATPLIKDVFMRSLNAKVIGDLYAGDVEHRGAEHYYLSALKLGRRLGEG